MLSAVAVGLYFQENGTNDQRRHSVGSFFICWAHDRRTCFYTVSFPFILGHFFPLHLLLNAMLTNTIGNERRALYRIFKTVLATWGRRRVCVCAGWGGGLLYDCAWPNETPLDLRINPLEWSIATVVNFTGTLIVINMDSKTQQVPYARF